MSTELLAIYETVTSSFDTIGCFYVQAHTAIPPISPETV